MLEKVDILGLKSSHLTWESMGIIIGGVCPVQQQYKKITQVLSDILLDI